MTICSRRAAFFVLAGSALVRPETVRRAVAEGHTVGLHSFSHPNLTAVWESGNATMLYHEIDEAASVLEAVTGVRPVFFRPPYGACNSGLRDYLHARGFAIAMWSSGCIDWALDNATAEGVIEVDGLADAGGVICMHDRIASTVAGVGPLITALRSGPEGGWVNPQGRRLISLEQCIEGGFTTIALPPTARSLPHYRDDPAATFLAAARQGRVVTPAVVVV